MAKKKKNKNSHYDNVVKNKSSSLSNMNNISKNNNSYHQEKDDLIDTNDKINESSEDVKNLSNREKLDITKHKVQAEEIYLTILEKNVFDLNQQLIEIKEKEILYLEKLKREFDEKNRELEENFQKNNEALEKERLLLQQEFSEKEKIIREELELRESELTENFTIKSQQVENELSKKNEEYNKRKEDLEREYEQKDKDLIASYNNKFTRLDIEFKEKNSQLLKELELMHQELEEEYASKMVFLDDYEQELIEENERTKKELQEENERIQQEVFNKIEEQKNAFEEFMQTQKSLFEEKVRLKEEEHAQNVKKVNEDLDKRKEELEKQYKDNLASLKVDELKLLETKNELNTRIEQYNSDFQKFEKEKSDILKRYTICSNFYKYIHKNKLKMFIFIAVLILMLCYFYSIFVYNIAPKHFISNTISNRQKTTTYSNNVIITLDTSKAGLVRFTELNGLSLNLNYNFNDKYYEYYNKYILSDKDNFYEWERYYKENTMIMKSPFHGQNVIVSDFTNKGFQFKESETMNNFIEAFREYLSKSTKQNLTEINRINVTSRQTFFDYIKQILFLSSNYEYYYTLSNNDGGQELFENCLKSFINSNNYKSFLLEENAIQTKLNMQDNLITSRTIFENIINYSTVRDVKTNIKIVEGDLLGTVYLVFELDYQDNSMVTSVPININLTYTFDVLESNKSLEQEDFVLNACFLESLGE